MFRPLQIGITGGIGSGKSIISKIFNVLGAAVYDADSHARALMTTDAAVVELIKKEFGAASYHSDGTLNRSYLSSETFGKADRIQKLNSIVHPRVALDYDEWRSNQKTTYILREAAILYESNSHFSLDKVIVVAAPEDIRVKRIIQRDPQRSVQQIKAIMASQWPEEEKLKQADYIILNDDHSMIIPQVLKLHNEFISLVANQNLS